ncbi:MAG: SDR family NAD(P)-dependent oxidoreductase [Solirubrobacteraceae bacterium]
MSSTQARPLAVVTGASSGIGFELARQFAEHGYDLIIAAEDDAIDTAAGRLRNGTAVEAVQVDLATPDGVERLCAHIRASDSQLEAVALNAGIGMGGDFARDTDLDQELKLVDLNVRSTVHLAKRVVSDMVERGSGKVLFTSSIASTMPGTYQAVYNASKSFVQSFALALRAELKDTGVTITSLMPGPTDTEFFERADMMDTKVGASDSKDDPADVARDGFEALMAGKERVVSHSLSTKAQSRLSRVMPDSVKAEMHRRMAEPGSANQN